VEVEEVVAEEEDVDEVVVEVEDEAGVEDDKKTTRHFYLVSENNTVL
jgi:hypothetical protein